jgi:FKBP-type peptidyl-prolyl cis-trans isomerase
MRPGAKWIVIVPSELGYPLPGYDPFKHLGEPHFHVSPNTLLIYDVEIIG